MTDQKAYLGKDSLISLKTELRELIPRKLFFVHGKQSYVQCGAKKEFDKIIGDSSVEEWLEFSDFSTNPEYTDLQKALDLCNGFQPDLIMAVGGGSAIDMAKLIRFFYSYQGNVENGQYVRKSRLVPLIAIPTTSGTGAEATHFAVLYKNKTKYSVEHDDVLPNIAVVYPPFTYKNSPYLTACTGFDALAQAIEAFWNRNATEESDDYARKAIDLIYPNLPRAVKSPTEEVRDKMAEGAYWAGRAINITKTTAPHAFSYGLTSIYGYPHGHAVAIVFSEIMKFNLQYTWKNNKKNQLIELLENNQKKQDLNIKNYIKDINLDLKNITYNLLELSSRVNSQRLSNNPCNISKEDIMKIYKRSLSNQIINNM